MAIRRPITDLSDGWPPDPEPRFAPVLAEKWRADNEQRRAEHVPSGALFSASNAGKCSRYLSYRAAGIPDSDPMDLTGHHNVTLGNHIHDEWQAAVGERFTSSGVVVRFEVEHRFLDGRGIVRLDAVFDIHDTRDGDRTVAYELKSVNGFGFKGAVGKIRRGTPPEGPRNEAVLQGAIGALCEDADELIIGNIAKESISANYGMDEADRFTAEWTLTREQYTPVAKLEIERVEAILGLVADGHLAARKIPGSPGEIVDPSTGRFEVRDADGMILDTGTHWACGYCSAQTLCIATEPGRIPVETAVELRKAMV